MWRACVLLLASCGRFGFSSPSDAAPRDADAAVEIDAPVVDAPPGTTFVTFGEAPGTTYANVTIDVHLDSAFPTTARGNLSTLLCEASPARPVLLRFDVSALPASTTVIAADLIFSTFGIADSPATDIYEVLESWTELDATWQDRTTGVSWQGAGATPPSRSAMSLATFAVQNTTTRITAALTDAAPVIQRWVADPASNHGFALVSASGSWNAAAHDHNGDIYRPVLRLTIVAP
jgi:hypothetical protein